MITIFIITILIIILVIITLLIITLLIKIGNKHKNPHAMQSEWLRQISLLYNYSTLHYITLHYITLHYITLHYSTLQYITVHNDYSTFEKTV